LPALSLISVSYNSAATVADTLESVNAQSFQDLEYVVVDGASKDDTVAIVQRFGKRVTRLLSEPDHGIYDAYNKGLSLVSGDVIGFINSDDFYSHPDSLAAAMEPFQDPEVDAVHADLVYVERDSPDRITRHWRSAPITEERLARGYAPAHPTLFLRRSVYEQWGGFDTSYRLAADFEFMFRIFYRHRVKSVYLPRVLVRMRTGGATGESWQGIYRQNAEILRAMKQHGASPSLARFFATKVLDRISQRARARIIRSDSIPGLSQISRVP